MNKFLIVIISCLSLTGCFWQSTTGYSIGLAQEYCADKGGLNHMDVLWYGSVHVFCNDRFKPYSINNRSALEHYNVSRTTIDAIEKWAIKRRVKG